MQAVTASLVRFPQFQCRKLSFRSPPHCSRRSVAKRTGRFRDSAKTVRMSEKGRIVDELELSLRLS